MASALVFSSAKKVSMSTQVGCCKCADMGALTCPGTSPLKGCGRGGKAATSEQLRPLQLSPHLPVFVASSSVLPVAIQVEVEFLQKLDLSPVEAWLHWISQLQRGWLLGRLTVGQALRLWYCSHETCAVAIRRWCAMLSGCLHSLRAATHGLALCLPVD